MLKPTYNKCPTYATWCGKCNSQVTLLYHRVNQTGHPSFYICWNCRTVYQIGKDEVIEEL